VTPDTIGKRLALARHFSGLTASRLGVLAGLSNGTVLMIEKGARVDPSSGSIGQLAIVLAVSTDWLINGTGEEPDPDTIRASAQAADEAASHKPPTDPEAAE